jgi:myosin heavy subunit
MKIGIWKRIILAVKLLLGVDVVKDVRLLLAHEFAPLRETLALQASRVEAQCEALEAQERALAHTRDTLAESCSREEKTLEELEDLTASIDAKIATVERHAEQKQASALAEQKRLLTSHLEEAEAGFTAREEQFRMEQAQAVQAKAEELDAVHRAKISEQAIKTESLLQSVLFDLRGGGGEDDRYAPDRAYEFCKNLSPQSCKSLRHIVKIESRLTDAENTVRLHLRSPDDTSSPNSPVKTSLPLVE